MRKIILIVEDLPIEQEKAKLAVLSLDCTPLVASNLDDGIRLLKKLKASLFGVVTDIHYQSTEQRSADADKPNGLAMVALCVKEGVRVAVCSNVDHHYSQYLDLPLEVLSSHPSYGFSKIPSTRDSKNWERVITELLNL